MANLLVAGNSSNGGTAITTDTSGTLNIVTGSGSGANAITIDASQNVTFANAITTTGNGTIGGALSVTGNTTITGTLTATGGVANNIKAWVNFNGTGTVAIRGSFNVTSITDNGTGDYTINFTNAMTDANYSIAGTASRNTIGNYASFFSPYSSAPTTTALRIQAVNFAGGLEDSLYTSVSIFR